MMRSGDAAQSAIEELRKNLQSVVRDTEALLKVTEDVDAENIQEARDRARRTLREAIDTAYDRRLRRRMRQMALSTGTYVRDNSWSVVGAGVGIGLLVAMLMRRH
ncbi:MAG: hypothetical protein DIU71_09370 [Proteobacteria bacterium]|nr:MAG: hypothetical protein DIU71_09370 [Pseudomonadota bacterium]